MLSRSLLSITLSGMRLHINGNNLFLTGYLSVTVTWEERLYTGEVSALVGRPPRFNDTLNSDSDREREDFITVLETMQVHSEPLLETILDK